MPKNAPDKEVDLIHKALGNRSDPLIWPPKISAASAIQRLIKTRNQTVLQALTEAEILWEERTTQQLEELSEEHHQMLFASERQVETLNLAIDRAEQIINRLESQVSELKQQLSAEQKRTIQLNAETARLHDEIMDLQHELSLSVYEKLKSKIISLRHRVETRLKANQAL